MSKTPIGLRLSDEAIALADRLAKSLGTSRASVIEIAIRALASKHKIK